MIIILPRIFTQVHDFLLECAYRSGGRPCTASQPRKITQSSVTDKRQTQSTPETRTLKNRSI